MNVTRTSMLAATAAVALLASPMGFVGVGHAQGNSDSSAGLAGDMGGGHGVAAGAQSGDRGVSGQAIGRGHGGFGANGDDGDSVGASQGGTASSLGSLNASSASSTARSNASIDSVVGQLGAYEAAIADGDLESAGEHLASAANQPITGDVLAEVNARLDIDLNEAQFTAVLDAAVDSQATVAAE